MGGPGMRILGEERPSFLEKRSKKLFSFWCARGSTAHLNFQKFFGSFFKKELLSFLPFRAPQAKRHESVPTTPDITKYLNTF
jgi:hypothetical protein